MSKKRKILNYVIGIGLLLVVWQLLSIGGDSNSMKVPSILDVIKATEEIIENGVLLEDILISLYRFAMGYLIASISAIILGLILGWYQKVWHIIDPIIQLLRPISPTAWYPFIVMLFGLGNLPAIVIIFISTFFPVLLATVNAVRNLDKNYIKIADNFEIKGFKFVYKIVIPAIFPYITNALHLALGSAWIFLVAGEMVGAQSGLGFLIIDSRNNLRIDMLLSGIIFIGIIGLILDKSIGKVEKLVKRKWGEA